MKKLILTILTPVLILSAVGCAQTAPPSAEIAPEKVVETKATEDLTTPDHKYKKIIDEYNAFIETVTKKEPLSAEEQTTLVHQMYALCNKKEPAEKIYRFFVENIEKLEAPQSDQFAEAAIIALQRAALTDSEKLSTDTEDFSSADPFYIVAKKYNFNYALTKRHAEEITDDSLKNLLLDAGKSGYLIGSSEGMLYYEVDFTEFAKYSPYYSKSFAAFVTLNAYSNMSYLTSDAAISTSLDDIVARALEAEKALKDYTGDRYQKYIALTYTNYVNLLMLGTNNTPAYDYDTTKIRDEIVDLFKELSALEGTKLSSIIKSHMETLEASNGLYSDAVIQKVNTNIQTLENQYQITEDDRNRFDIWHGYPAE